MDYSAPPASYQAGSTPFTGPADFSLSSPPPSAPLSSGKTDDEREALVADECRYCFRSVAPWDLIRPCACDGVVHRACLDRWRAVSPSPDSFSMCDACRTPFEFEDEDEASRRRELCSARCRFGWGVTLHLALVLMVAAGVATLYALVILPAADPMRSRDRIFPVGWAQGGIDALCGIVLLFATVGVVGCVFIIVRALASACSSCCQCCYSDSHEGHARPYTATSYPYYQNDIFFFYCCFPVPTVPHNHPHQASSCCNTVGCGDCGGCNCSGGDAGGEGGVLILLVIIVIFAVIGFFISIFLMCLLGVHFTRKYKQMVERFEETRRKRVKDLALAMRLV